MGLFGAKLLKCARAQIRTKSAKVGDGRPARSRAPGGLAPPAGQAKLLKRAAPRGAEQNC